MKIYLKFAGGALAAILLFIGIPKILQLLLNSHSDIGIVAIVAIVCGIFSVFATKLYNDFVKENTENER